MTDTETVFETSVKIRVGNYILSKEENNTLWLATLDGEGTAIWPAELENILDKYFKENM